MPYEAILRVVSKLGTDDIGALDEVGSPDGHRRGKSAVNETHSSKVTEIDRNLTQFLKVLPSLVHDHAGSYALIRHGNIIDFFPTAMDAQIAGNQRFQDQVFSIQLVDGAAEELGYFSYALHSG